MHAWLGQRYGDAAFDANVLVAGDLNATPGSPSLGALVNAAGAFGPVSLRDPLSGTGEAGLTHPSDAPERRLDYVLVSDGAAGELVPGSAKVLRPEGAATLSDHLPVVVDLVARE
jgi:endonuclease/exonuclease/phosphatase family metal-dependent hydrolase